MRALICAALIAAASPAFAWDITQNGTTGAAAVADQGGPAQSQQATGGNARARATGGTSRATGGNAAGGSVTNTITTGGGSAGGWSGRIPVSSAIPATVVNGGCNSGGGSAALQLPGIGLGGALGGRQDVVCQLVETGRAEVAFSYLCQRDSDVRAAAKANGTPCPQDRPAAVPAAAPQPVATQGPPDRCYTTDAHDPEKQRLECRRWFERTGVRAPHPI